MSDFRRGVRLAEGTWVGQGVGEIGMRVSTWVELIWKPRIYLGDVGQILASGSDKLANLECYLPSRGLRFLTS